MPRNRSVDICPKCNRPGYESWQWTRSNYNVHSPETSLFKGTYIKEKFSEGVVQKQESTSIPSKNYRIQSKKYPRRYFIHNIDNKRKKCYVDNFPLKRKPGSELIKAMTSFKIELDNFMKMIEDNPPDLEDDRKLAMWINEFLTSRDWIRKMSEECAEHGINLKDIESSGERIYRIPIEGLIDIMSCNPLWRVTNYYYYKYVLPQLDQNHSYVNKKLSKYYR